MKTVKDELQDIILGDEQIGGTSQLKKIQSFLRRYAEASGSTQKQQHIESEETTLLTFIQQEAAFYILPYYKAILPTFYTK